jgi:long-subunit fatty acid transport protein
VPKPLRLFQVAGLVGSLAALGLAPAAHGSPIDDPHVGGIGFAGPTTDDLSALYWNPAALGLGTGRRAMFSLIDHTGRVDVERAPVDPQTGQPGGTQTFPATSGYTGGLRTPLGPGSFGTAAFPLGSRVTVALGWFYPFAQRQRFDPVPASPAGSPGATASDTLPTRYHVITTNLSTISIAPAISALLGAGVRLGLSPALQISTGSLVVDRDTGAPSGGMGTARLCGDVPCGAENPAAAARYAVSSGRAVSFSLALGIHVNRPRWSMGLSWTSAPFGTREGIEIEAESSRIDPPARLAGAPSICPSGLDPCVSSRMVFHLPMMVAAGIDRRLTARWDIGVQMRWLDLSVHDAIAVRVVGPAGGTLRSAGLPEELLLYRGLQDVLDLRLRTIVRLGDRFDVAASVRGETAAVREEATSPAAPGGRLIEPSLALRVRLNTVFVLTAGYAYSFMPWVNASSSAFDPGAHAACEATGGNLDAEPCRKRQIGLAGPTAAGRYRAHTHAFGLSASASF